MNEQRDHWPGAVCVVAGGEPTLDGSVPIGERLAALALAARGRRVHFLWCGSPRSNAAFREHRRALQEAGVHVHRLEEVAVPSFCRQPNGTPGCSPALYQSNLVRFAVESLHGQSRFDAVVFAAWQALGFRCVQAKRAGTAFAAVRLAVRLDCISAWLRDADKRWPAPKDCFIDYCERYMWNNADVRCSASPYLRAEARRLGWRDADLKCDPLVATGPATSGVVFVVNPETDRSCALFLDAAESLDPSVPLSVLAPTKSRRLVRRIAARLRGRPCSVLSCVSQRRSVKYLAGGRRLAVFCDRTETLSPLLRDCIINGLPFLAAAPCWLPGQIADAAPPAPWFFDANAPDADRRIGAAVRSWLDGAATAVAEYDLAAAVQPSAPAPSGHHAPSASPIVTVAVTYYNLGRYLPETLASLAAQTYSDLEVLVIDDGSSCPESRRVWEQQQRLYPQFRFIQQANAGLGAARNRALRDAAAPYFIPVDADNIAAPHMVECFVRAMRGDPGVAAMTCFFLAFKDTGDIEKGEFLYQCCPLGGPHVASCAYNVYGDANAVFRTEDLRAVGGFPEDRSTYCHDWETFVKLTGTGRRVAVVPEYLFYYRRRADGMAAVMTRNGTDLYRFVQRMLATAFDGESAEDRMLWTTFAASLLPHEPRSQRKPWSPARLLRATVRRVAAVGRAVRSWAAPLFRPAAPERLRHLVSDPLAHRPVHQTAVVPAGDNLDDGVAAEVLQRRL